jgi:C-terminal processing protease CtpA/Prc
MFAIRSKGSGNRGPSEQSRRIEAAWSLRLLVVAAALTAAIVIPLAVRDGRRHPLSVPVQQSGSRQFSPNLSHSDLVAAVKASLAAHRLYIKHDRVKGELEGIDEQFADITSEGELLAVLNQLGQKTGDDWFMILTDAEYKDLLVRRSGAEVGVDIEINFDTTLNAWKVDKAGSLAVSDGIKVGDVVTEIDGFILPVSDMTVRQQLQAGIKRYMKSGVLHTGTTLTVKRNGQPQFVTLTRGILSRAPAFSIGDFKNPLEGTQTDVKEITFNHLEGATMENDLYQELRSAKAAGLRGLIVDLRKLTAGDSDRAVRVAAMFLGQGVITHKIQTTSDSKLEMVDYVIENGKVHRKTWGPYAVETNGAIDPAISKRDAQKPDKDEVLNCPVNVVDVPVVAIQARETSGAGELIANAFTNNWEKGDKRAMTVARFLTAGNGIGRTYFPVGPYWLRLSTSYHLRPDGDKIETTDQAGRTVGPNPNVGVPDGINDELDFARTEMVELLNVVPLPDRLPEPKK